MSFGEIVGHGAVISSLKRAFCNNRLSSSYLFTGPEGVGKQKTARVFVKLLVCERPHEAQPCGLCGSCRRVEAASHPDVQWVAPDGQFIKIDAVREACRRLSLKSFESGRKALVVTEAESLNEESSNALLKTLEEPTPQTVIILLARALSSVLPTIVSRCQRLFFAPLDEGTIFSILCERQLVKEEALYLSRVCEGSLGAALRCHESGLFGRKNDIVSSFLSRDLPLDEIAKQMGNDKTEKGERWEESLSVLSWWFRDMFLAKMLPGCRQLVNCDREADIGRLSRMVSCAEIERRLAVLAETKAQRERNLNFRLSLARLRAELWIP